MAQLLTVHFGEDDCQHEIIVPDYEPTSSSTAYRPTADQVVQRVWQKGFVFDFEENYPPKKYKVHIPPHEIKYIKEEEIEGK